MKVFGAVRSATALAHTMPSGSTMVQHADQARRRRAGLYTSNTQPPRLYCAGLREFLESIGEF